MPAQQYSSEEESSRNNVILAEKFDNLSFLENIYLSEIR